MRTATITLLPGEQEQYERMVAGWYAQWEPNDYQEYKLVDTLIVNDLLHRRAQRWLMETEAAIFKLSGSDPMGWTPEQERKLQFMQQRKASAERAFYRAWSVLQGLRKDIMRENQKINQLTTKLAIYKAREEGAEAEQPAKSS
jgi:hypothetical protein